MNKIKGILRRFKHLSFKRMFLQIKMIHKETGKSRIITFFDMLWCFARYNVGYLDYHVFGFATKRGKKIRSTYMTVSDNVSMVRRLNNREYYHVFDDKAVFNEKFDKYIKRRWLDLRKCDGKSLAAFCEGLDTVFAKPIDKCGGEGIRKIKLSEVTDFAKLYSELVSNGQNMVEQAIIQHEKMNELCPDSVNTIRIVTVVTDGKAHFMYALVRMGRGGTCMDNISSGGMYTCVGEGGRLSRPAFCDKTGEYYTAHPETKTVFDGFVIPYFNEAKEMCLEAAMVEPNMRYIGWDVAISPDGPLLVEGNNLPGYDMCQNAGHVDCGIRPKFGEIAAL